MLCFPALAETQQETYTRAQQLPAAEKYEEAEKAFASIAAYENSADFLMYARAVRFAEEGQTKLALRSFLAPGDFFDSPEQLKYYTARAAEAQKNTKRQPRSI